MAYVDVKCANCGRYLGRKSVPVLGIDLDSMGCKGECTDPDCEGCNIWYHDNCEICNANRINPVGICKRCGCSQSNSLPMAVLVIK